MNLKPFLNLFLIALLAVQVGSPLEVYQEQKPAQKKPVVIKKYLHFVIQPKKVLEPLNFKPKGGNNQKKSN